MFTKQRPQVLFLILLIFVFVAELSIMYLLDLIQAKSEMNWPEAYVDAILLTSLCVPFFWYFFMKPLESALKLENIRSHKILEMAAEGIISIDTKGNIQGALKNQVQHFSEKMLHGKNIQAVEC